MDDSEDPGSEDPGSEHPGREHPGREDPGALARRFLDLWQEQVAAAGGLARQSDHLPDPDARRHLDLELATVDIDPLQRRMLAARFVVARVGCDTVPTEVIGRPSLVIVVLTEGDQLAMRLTPKCGWSGKSRPEGRITSIHGAPARLRA